MSFNPKVALFSGAVQAVDYTPVSAVSSGSVVIINGVCYFATVDIAAAALGALILNGGVWAGNKASGAWAIGDQIFWNATGTPNVGTASSGAFNNTGAGIYVGDCVQSPGTTAGALTGDQLGYFAKRIASSPSQASTVAATGSTVADAAALNVGFNFVTGADGTKGTILPAGATGRSVRVKNSDAANAILKVYPPTGGTINALSANAAISMAVKTAAEFVCLDGTQWFTIPLVPS